MILLNIGSGDHPAAAPWINVDSHEGVSPDVVADARALPFKDASVTSVYCGHLLEHLSLAAGVPKALAEICRVLVPGGTVCVVGPDYQRALAFNDDVLLDQIRDGGCRWPGDRHLWLATGPVALVAVQQMFPDAAEGPIGDLDGFWPITSRVGWQFAITATKETAMPSDKEPVDEKQDQQKLKQEARERQAPERAIPYDNKETR